MAKEVVLEDALSVKDIRFVLGVDQAFVGRVKEKVISACVALSYPDLRQVDRDVIIEEVTFPYIPTFLMFREGDPAVRVVGRVLDRVGREGVVVIVDGSGIAHPRRCGLATYIALKLRVPTIGVTKRWLYGRVDEPKGVMESSPIRDDEEVIGYALKTCKACKPIFISPGSYISPETALEIVKSCLRGYKLPEPIRLAHELANKSKSKSLFDFL